MTVCTTECARNGYLRLYGESIDVIIDPFEFAFRVQPARTSTEDGNINSCVKSSLRKREYFEWFSIAFLARVPAMFFKFMSLTANKRLNDLSDGKRNTNACVNERTDDRRRRRRRLLLSVLRRR